MSFSLVQTTPVLDMVSDPVVLFREEKVIYRNRAAAELFPTLETDGVLSQTLAAVLPEAGGIAACTIEGKSYTVTVAGTPEGNVAVIRDVHESPKIRAHWKPFLTEQIREQLGALLAATHQLEGEAHDHGNTQYDKWLAVLNHNAYRLLRMVGAIELEQMLAEGNAYHSSTLDLAGLCHGLEMEVAPLAKQIGLAFSYEASDVSLLMTGDAALLRQMLLMLISNAMKAVGPGGSVGLRLAVRNGRAILTVWDDGPGLDERSLSNLFQDCPASDLPRPNEGLRLGLMNARNIAAVHGGVLVVESKQGDGARFTVSLPIKQPGGLKLRMPKPLIEAYGGFSSLLVELSDVLPWNLFLPEELE